ncbi:MAG: SBBP repeat-containing protein [Chitinophagales bacterium]|nr:SBBP repeat-containing protein [Chitinophagales bacterium]
MKKIVSKILAVILVCIITSANAQWALKVGSDKLDDNGYAICTDSVGNSYVTGNFRDTINFGNISAMSSGQTDIFIAKIDSLGNFIWVASAGGTSRDLGRAITVDKNGNCYVTGTFSGTAKFGSTTLTGGGVFIAKLNSDGTFIWVKKAGSSSTGNVGGYGITTDKNGNCYVTGYFDGSSDFGSNNLSGSGIFITKLDINGSFIWAKRLGGLFGQNNYARGISLDSDGNSYVVGYFVGTQDFGIETLTSAGSSDIAIFKISSQGNLLWIKQFGQNGDDRAYGISTDDGTNFYVTGSFMNKITFGSTELTSRGDVDIFITKIDTSGNTLWVSQAGGESVDKAFAISTDKLGNNYITGTFKDVAQFGNVNCTSVIRSEDVFVSKIDANGNFIWTKQAGGGSKDEGYGISIDAQGNSYITGSFFSDTATFGNIILTSNSFGDAFIAKFNGSSHNVGISDINKTDFSIYPNPASNVVTLTNLLNNTSVNITDLAGKQVYSTTANSTELSINTSGFANGVYLVNVTNNGAVATKKLVINK